MIAAKIALRVIPNAKTAGENEQEEQDDEEEPNHASLDELVNHAIAIQLASGKEGVMCFDIARFGFFAAS